MKYTRNKKFKDANIIYIYVVDVKLITFNKCNLFTCNNLTWQSDTSTTNRKCKPCKHSLTMLKLGRLTSKKFRCDSILKCLDRRCVTPSWRLHTC